MVTKRMLPVATVALVLSAAPVKAQIITTSIPRDVQAGLSAKRWQLHLMGGYTSWGASDELSGDLPRLSGFILAGDSAIHSGSLDYGLGGWYNRLSGGGNISSLYANAFYRHVGLQVGYIFSPADPIAFLVGRTGGDQPFTASVGVGALDSPDWTFSAFANASYRVVKQGSIDASFWYIAPGSIGISVNRLTIGAGYTF